MLIDIHKNRKTINSKKFEKLNFVFNVFVIRKDRYYH